MASTFNCSHVASTASSGLLLSVFKLISYCTTTPAISGKSGRLLGIPNWEPGSSFGESRSKHQTSASPSPSTPPHPPSFSPHINRGSLPIETPQPHETTASSSLAITPLNRVLSPPLGLIPPNTPPRLYSSCVSHFLSIPWCACLIQTPNTVPFIPQCFNPKSPAHDQLVGATLAGPRGLQHVLCFFHTEDEAHLRDADRPIMHVSSLFALGDGLSGYEGVLHGGMIMTMVDEAMGVLHEINLALGKTGEIFGTASVTAGLEIKFLKPGPVNQTVLVNAWVDSVEGRKTRVKCEVRDGNGIELAQCSSTWVSVRARM